MAQNAEQEGWGAEHQNLDKKLNAEWDTERIMGMAKTSWEKAAVGKKTETEKKKTMVQTEKKMVEMQKRTVKMWMTAEGTWKTAVVNEKMKWESLYQNHHNTHQMDGRTILYNL
jgi:predicted ATPase